MLTDNRRSLGPPHTLRAARRLDPAVGVAAAPDGVVAAVDVAVAVGEAPVYLPLHDRNAALRRFWMC